MGSVSSVYNATDHQETNEHVEESGERGEEEKENEKVVKLQLNHSFPLKEKRLNEESKRRQGNYSSIAIQFLVEENKRLKMENERLEREIDKEVDQDLIYGESLEHRLTRLEKHLAVERKEKWSAIEKSEKSRVDLVNCERELIQSVETIERLKSELETKKTMIKNLECEVSKLKDNKTEDKQDSLSEFRAELKAKRETRQRALAALSQELNGLREQLQIEKLQRKKVEDELEFRKKHGVDSSSEKILNDNANLRNEVNILVENLEKMKNLSGENIRLKCEVERKNQEIDGMNESLGELKFEFYEEKRKHERTMKRLQEMEERCKVCGTKEEWEDEKKKLFEKYDKEKEEINKRTNALKEVISITKQMLKIRESEVDELKKKLKEIEESVKNSRILQEDGLKAEYEKQLENIKQLRDLYEERVKLMETEREKLHETLQERSTTIQNQKEELENLTTELEKSREETKTEIHDKENLDRELRLTIARTKDLENEIRLINNLFTQMLLGPYSTGNEIDLDKLTELLQENHDLITEMTTREDSSEIASVLPKLLLDLIAQVDGTNDRKDDDVPSTCDTISEQSEALLEENQGAVLPILSYKNATLFKPTTTPTTQEVQELKMVEQINPAVQEIASNLPKVWRVLMELLSHHSVPEEQAPGDEKQCYKNVETPNGPRTVISVSKTFIRLKDLILEKKALQKELTRLKQLNSHLETRLDDQEKRLSQVQCELHKTWGIVGRMRAQHQQLHNNEKILRFELQEKRVMLSELKQELEYCRDKWERARQKNDESETEWKKLRREFAARKTKGYMQSNLNDSGESGFSDEQNESGEDGENFDADRSSTQSPIDRKLIDTQIIKRIDLAEEIIKQSENNLKQTSQNVEQTRLEECAEVQPTTSKTVRIEEEQRARAREARDLRLKNLEEQCKLLVRQVDITTHKSNYLNNRLEELHEQYGSTEDRRQAGTSRETKGSSSSSQKTEEDGELSQKERKDWKEKEKKDEDNN